MFHVIPFTVEFRVGPRGDGMQKRDRRLALIIIGLVLLVPIAWALLTVVIRQVVEMFI
jgi:hypothetical protein